MFLSRVIARGDLKIAFFSVIHSGGGNLGPASDSKNHCAPWKLSQKCDKKTLWQCIEAAETFLGKEFLDSHSGLYTYLGAWWHVTALIWNSRQLTLPGSTYRVRADARRARMRAPICKLFACKFIYSSRATRIYYSFARNVWTGIDIYRQVATLKSHSFFYSFFTVCPTNCDCRVKKLKK